MYKKYNSLRFNHYKSASYEMAARTSRLHIAERSSNSNYHAFLPIHRSLSLLSCLASTITVQSFAPVLSAQAHRYLHTAHPAKAVSRGYRRLAQYFQLQVFLASRDHLRQQPPPPSLLSLTNKISRLMRCRVTTNASSSPQLLPPKLLMTLPMFRQVSLSRQSVSNPAFVTFVSSEFH